MSAPTFAAAIANQRASRPAHEPCELCNDTGIRARDDGEVYCGCDVGFALMCDEDLTGYAAHDLRQRARKAVRS